MSTASDNCVSTITDDTWPPAPSPASPTSQKWVLFFMAAWHDACQKDGPLDQLLQTLAAANNNNAAGVVVKFGTVNVDENPKLVETFNVEAVPTFVFLNSNGKVVERLTVGPDDAAQITQAVSRLLQDVSSPNESEGQEKTEEELLSETLEKLIRKDNVMLFMKGSPTTPRCGFSRQMVEILVSNQIQCSTFDILTNDKIRQGLKTYSNWPTYPQLYVNGELIGGLDIIKEMLADTSSGSLAEQLGVVVSSSTPAAEAKPEKSLNDRLHDLINQDSVMLFMKGLPSSPRCGFSRQMVEILDSYTGQPYGAFDILTDEEVRQGLKTYSNWPTYPQLYINGELIGGLDIVKEMQNDGSLQEALLDNNNAKK